MRTVTVPDNVVTGKPFTPEEWVGIVGCGLTLEQYRDVVLKLATYTHQGTHDRGKEQDATGRWMPAPIHPETGQPLQEDNPADEIEIKFKKLLRTSLLLHINQAHCLNRWPQPGEFRKRGKLSDGVPPRAARHARRTPLSRGGKRAAGRGKGAAFKKSQIENRKSKILDLGFWILDSP